MSSGLFGWGAPAFQILMASDFPAELLEGLDGYDRSISGPARPLEQPFERPSVTKDRIWEHVEGRCI